ncbi:MAG: DUF192 domain-containing protein [Candidatus Doudnabacteria bacterium]|nr:DUF192 domain-containing protein [Candidatus Doudnabacteria bacterium]
MRSHIPHPSLYHTLPLSLLCLLIISLGSWRIWHHTHPKPLPHPQVAVGGHTFTVRIASTPEEQRLGLGGVGSLSLTEGMYFPFSEPKTATFWMKGMQISIDLLWIRNGIVIGMERSLPPADNTVQALPTWKSPAPVDAVLEIAAGAAEKLSLQVGDFVSTEHIKMPTQ